jgi:paraquat-inducible protein B
MEIIDSAGLTVGDVRKLVQTVNVQVAPLTSIIENTVNDYGRLARNADSQIKPLASNIDGTLVEYKKLARGLDRQLDPVTKEISRTAKSATAALKRADSTIKEIETMFSKKSVTRTEINKTLKALSAAARSIRIWADYLERHPESLIRGKGGYRR